MEIKTKYNVGEWVWVMHNNKPFRVPITEVSVSVSRHGEQTEIYQINLGSSTQLVSVDGLRDSKEELQEMVFGDE